MKRLIIRVSSLFKGFVLALIFSVFLQASLASAIDIESQDDLEDIGVVADSPLDGEYVVTQSFDVVAPSTGDGNSYVNGTFTGTFTGLFYGFISTISGLTKPLFNVIGAALNITIGGVEIDTVEVKDLNLTAAPTVEDEAGGISGGITGNGALANILEAGGTIEWVSSVGDVTGIGNDVGGLVGYSGGDISNSSATGVVTGIGNNVGGLVGLTNGTIDNSYAAGEVDGGAYAVGGLVGYSAGAITNSSATVAVEGNINVGGLVGESSLTSTIDYSIAAGTVTGTNNVGGLAGYSDGAINYSAATGGVIGSGEYIGGLVGESYGTITNSYATGNVNDPGEVSGLVGYEVGGLVGYLGGTLDNTYATGNVVGKNSVGGLVGETGGSFADISNSYAKGFVGGYFNVGGLVGSSDISITNSYATGYVTAIDDPLTGKEGAPSIEGYGVGGLVGALSYNDDISNSSISNSYATGFVWGTKDVGGLVGSSYSTNSTINNSYAAGEVTGVGNFVGGLVGYSLGVINNSYAIGDVYGVNSLGGLVGTVSEQGTIDNSYATGDVTSISLDPDYIGGLVGYSSFKDGAESDEQISLSSYSTGTVTISDNLQIGDIYASSAPAPEILSIVNTPFGVDPVPAFAVSASINDGLPYLTSLELSYDVVEEDTEETPSFNLRSYYTQAAKSLDKALTSLGFKSNLSSHSNLGFKALEQNQSKLPPVIQLFEVSEYQNSNILLNKEDGLQLSISSYYKESVEIWTQGLNGEYLYLGLVEFDKDGKAILPTLKFDTANTYQLLMIKAADKLSEKPNLERKIGQITINVI